VSGALAIVGAIASAFGLTGGAADAGAWLNALQPASWNGVPFAVLASEIAAGRKTADHNYPFRDTIWVEDLGKKGRIYTFRGFLVGDDCYEQEKAMLAAAETPGVGELIHPSLGSLMVALVEFTSGIEAERGRVVTLNFRFSDSTSPIYPGSAASTQDATDDDSDDADDACASDFSDDVSDAFSEGADVVTAAAGAVQGFANAALAVVGDAGLFIAAVAGLSPPPLYTYGRYANGALGSYQTGVITVDLALANTTTSIAAVVTAAADVVTLAEAGVPAPLATAVQALTASVQAAIPDPADQVRLLSVLAGYTPTTIASTAPIGQAIQTAQEATGALCRRSALTALARATALYQPTSYQDAVTLRNNAAALFDAEILIAANNLDVASYQALRQVRTDIVEDLNTRAATLPALITVNTPAPLPAFTLAYQLYADGSRCDDVIARANPVHPAFMPTSMVLLSA
jgi:prophage DNA circulation protein